MDDDRVKEGIHNDAQSHRREFLVDKKRSVSHLSFRMNMCKRKLVAARDCDEITR